MVNMSEVRGLLSALPAVICQTFFSQTGRKAGEQFMGERDSEALLMGSSLLNVPLIMDNEAITAEWERH